MVSTIVDAGQDGQAASSYRTYCAAMGFAVSRAIDGTAKVML